ncbi:hypothetical protein BCR41DRAFT_49792 [Lobosporangium transversale]|uniref:Uncharacterized protein n=1 Tax=Lobosporangium transversale TaxID=64571 RepID=A0A1Y2GQJ3_9FUNG|nr:hypothetical protein BCR41DRAFT_49792 [Lobosporangium transversale]ORZ17525.1 hypothetical protein BCR41DRAFT_49792 [Lobosporangium transversale]|eukprot:XP_021881912.1 hypothetical protein BCR41DRAFT_49792 [Lobosporangium transversale]
MPVPLFNSLTQFSVDLGTGLIFTLICSCFLYFLLRHVCGLCIFYSAIYWLFLFFASPCLSSLCALPNA